MLSATRPGVYAGILVPTSARVSCFTGMDSIEALGVWPIDFQTAITGRKIYDRDIRKMAHLSISCIRCCTAPRVVDAHRKD